MILNLLLYFRRGGCSSRSPFRWVSASPPKVRYSPVLFRSLSPCCPQQVTKMGAARQSAQATLNYFRCVGSPSRRSLAACLNQCRLGVTCCDKPNIYTMLQIRIHAYRSGGLSVTYRISMLKSAIAPCDESLMIRVRSKSKAFCGYLKGCS